jgi:tight adherence protein B
VIRRDSAAARLRRASRDRGRPAAPPPSPPPGSVAPRGAGDLVAGLGQVAAALRAGADPDTAWRHHLGVTVVDGVPVLEDLVTPSGGDVASARAVRAAARLAAEVGVAPAVVLDRVAASLAQAAEEAGQRRAALAGPRATARLLAWLPAFGILLGLALGADPLAVLLDGRAGSALLAAGAGLTAVGRWWTARYLRAAAAAGADS